MRLRSRHLSAAFTHWIQRAKYSAQLRLADDRVRARHALLCKKQCMALWSSVCCRQQALRDVTVRMLRGRAATTLRHWKVRSIASFATARHHTLAAFWRL